MLRAELGLAAAALLAAAAPAPAAPLPPEDAERNRPAAPVRIADNLYHVGTRDIAVYLFVDPKGLILLDAAMSSRCRWCSPISALWASIRGGSGS